MRDAILDSPLMALNNLNQRFSGTYGFSVAFRRETVSEVLRQFPSFGPFFDVALRRDCNAFFLNPLLVIDGTEVAPHQDFSLHSYCASAPFPCSVSALYLEVPSELVGGALRLYRDKRLLASIVPVERALISFRGDLRHAVEAVRSGAPHVRCARLSLIIEQYRLGRKDLATIPDCHISTRRLAPTRSAAAVDDLPDDEFGSAVRAQLET